MAQVVAQIQNAYAYHVRNPIYQIPTKKNNRHPVTKAWERIGKETKLMWWKLLQVLKFAQKAQFDIYDLT